VKDIHCSMELILVLRRGLEDPALSLFSDSSGGSESGLEVVVKGLPGGLVPSAVEAAAELLTLFAREILFMFRWILSDGSRVGLTAGDVGELRAR
jgi:hypothetical protein